MKGSGTYEIRIRHEPIPVPGNSVHDSRKAQESGIVGTSTGRITEVQGDHVRLAGPGIAKGAVQSGSSTSQQPVQGNTVHPADRMRGHWDSTQMQVSGVPQLQSQHAAQRQQDKSAIAANSPNMNIAGPPKPNNDLNGTSLLAEASSATVHGPGQALLPTPGQTARSSTKTASGPTQNHSGDDSNTDNIGTNYCRHWCHRGTCKWGFLCRYSHTMPDTLQGLAEVGLKEFPPWWTASLGLTLMNNSRLNSMGFNSCSRTSAGVNGTLPKRRLKEVRGLLNNLTTMNNLTGRYQGLGGLTNLGAGTAMGLLPPYQQHQLQTQLMQLQQQQLMQLQQQPTTRASKMDQRKMTPLDKARSSKSSRTEIVSPANKRGADNDKPVKLTTKEGGGERVVQAVAQGPPVVQTVEKRLALQRDLSKNVVDGTRTMFPPEKEEHQHLLPVHQIRQSPALMDQHIPGHDLGPQPEPALPGKLVDV